MILFLKHIGIEGPETICDFFKKKKFQMKELELQKGDPLPSDLKNIEAVVSLGGPMNVYEEEKYPFLAAEDKFIKKVLKEEIPFLGVCLGSQLLSKAAGSSVGKSPVKEVGFFGVDLTKQGEHDPLFHGLKNKFEVYQWHEDMFEIPKNGKLLASSPNCPHQAFRYGRNAYGLQFHVEITDKTIIDWTDEYFKSGDAFLLGKRNDMLKRYQEIKETFHKNSDTIYENFLTIMQATK
jgi:GMP synthase (glutamine-hydrolysing)